MKKKKNHSQ